MVRQRRTGGPERVANDAVWRQTRRLFLASTLFFVVTIVLGFWNALLAGPIPRWRGLAHLHSGTVGWITLSLIGLAIWLFTGRRDVSARYARTTGALVWLGALAFAGYVAGFAVAFSRGGRWFVLLVGFGAASMLLVWAAAAYAATQLRRQPVVTNVHALVTGGLLVAAVGATMGVLLGLEYVVGAVLPIAGERIGVHAGMMDTYVLLVASAVVEWLVRPDAGRWTRPGLAQALSATAAAVLVPFAFVFDLVPVLAPVFAVLLLVFLVLFLGRTGWRALRTDPLSTGPRAWGFFGTLWLVVFVALFLWAAVALQGQLSAAPEWFPAALNHTGFVGTMTNLLFGVLSVRTRATGDVLPWGEPAALWLTNLGLALFVGMRIATGTRHGAFVMGLGVLLGVATMFARLWVE